MSESKSTLEQQAKFQNLIADLSTRFVNSQDHELDQTLTTALAQIGDFFAADRAYIFRFDNELSFSNSHEWCAPGVEPQIDTLQNLPCDAFPWAMAKVNAGECVEIPDVSALPEEAKAEQAELERQDIKSALWLPLLAERGILGFFGFDLVTSHRIWSEKHLNLLRISAEIMASSLYRSATQSALRESEQRYRKLFEESREAQLIICAPDWHIQSCNRAAIEMFRLDSIDDFSQLTPADLSTPVQPDGRPTAETVQALISQAITEGSNYFEWQHQRLDGEIFPAMVLLTCMEMQGQLIIQGSVRDITRRKQNEEKLRLSASVFANAREGIMITDTQGIILEVNQAFTDITGYSRSEVLGESARMLSSGIHEPAFFEALWSALQKQGYWHGEIWNKHRDGHTFVELLTISAIPDESGKLLQYLGLFSDITAQKAYQERLEHIAHYDELTGLPNRSLLARRLKDAMKRAQAHDSLLAIAYIDLDGFKAINDQHGHNIGDQLLVRVAERMRQALRDNDTIARLGGDEFAAVLGDLDSISASEPILQRLLASAASPIVINDLVLGVSGSIGVTVYPQPEDVDADQLLRQADQAMYNAKVAGKNRFQIFDAEHDRQLRGHHESLQRIRQALLNDEFVLHYQPKVNLQSGEIIGAEALIRWQHPEKGLLPPAAFLSVIENHTLDIDVGDWVIRQALSQTADWYAQGIRLPVSVNISAMQLQQSFFIDTLKQQLSLYPQLPEKWLELEILETSALEDMSHVTDLIEAGTRIGVIFALDDFGTGYSSLTYLKRLPVAILKIDQTFVRDMLDDPEDLAILEGVLGLASAFRRQAIAEGVETLEHGHFLLRLGCEFAQGYGIARPMPAEKIPDWITQWKSAHLWSDASPLPRDQLPVLYSRVEYRAWQKALEIFLLSSDSDALPQPTTYPQQGLMDWLNRQLPEADTDTAPKLHALQHASDTVARIAQEFVELRIEQGKALTEEQMKPLQLATETLLNQLLSWLET